jgi:hypothetical protein
LAKVFSADISFFSVVFAVLAVMARPPIVSNGTIYGFYSGKLKHSLTSGAKILNLATCKKDGKSDRG